MAKKLRSLLRGAARVHLPSSEPGRALCRARGTQDPDRYKVTCRRCIKLAEINAGKRKGRRPKKFGQKFRQQLLLGGERRNPPRRLAREPLRNIIPHRYLGRVAIVRDQHIASDNLDERDIEIILRALHDEGVEATVARMASIGGSPYDCVISVVNARTNPVTTRGPAFFDEPGFYPSSPVGLTQRALHKAIERIDRAPDHAALHRAHQAALDLYRKRGNRALGRDAGTLFNDINFSYTARYKQLGPTEEDLHTERMRAARAAEKAGRAGRRSRRNGGVTWAEGGAFPGVLATGDAGAFGTFLIQRKGGALWLIHNPRRLYSTEPVPHLRTHEVASIEEGQREAAEWLAGTRRNGSPRNVEHGLERARYIQQDAHEALLSAAAKRDMRGVQKYADQIARAQDAEQELERAMSYVGKAQRKRHITGSWRTEDRLKDVGLAEWRQKLAGQSVGRALAKLRPNGRGHDPADREQAIGQLRALGMPLDEAVANLDGARKDGYSYSSVVRWARRHYEADRDNAMGGAFGPAD